ncbi:MAG: electron transfer flavoprotein subunit beta/FixA family protein [Myxococcota bacterium]|nr:electron transfer flavoprotein subunit beta/FixA family protein [Myxococcota bacterium]
MRIVICVKEVLDPDAVNNYAIAGRLEIGDDGMSLTQTAIPRLMNGFDEQALEAALRIKDTGVDCSLTVVSIGEDPSKILKHCAALGADSVVAIKTDAGALDGHGVATLLLAQIEAGGGADLILCGRQASDDDQGVVPALIAERLGMPLVTFARAVEASGSSLKVTRVVPDGDEVVEVVCPAVVTVSNELGEPRYPTAAAKIKARKVKPQVTSPADLGVADGDLAPRIQMIRQFVPTVQGNCEFIDGGSPAEQADKLIARLREESLLS